MLLTKSAIALISPLGTALVLGLLAWLLGLLGKRAWALALGGLALAWLGFWGCLPPRACGSSRPPPTTRRARSPTGRSGGPMPPPSMAAGGR